MRRILSFHGEGKEVYQMYKARAELLYYSINVLFADIFDDGGERNPVAEWFEWPGDVKHVYYFETRKLNYSTREITWPIKLLFILKITRKYYNVVKHAATFL